MSASEDPSLGAPSPDAAGSSPGGPSSGRPSSSPRSSGISSSGGAPPRGDLWHTGRLGASDLVRALASACVMLSAVVHLDLWANGMRNLDVVGPAFLLNGAGGIVLGVLLLVWRHWLPLLGAVGFGLATLTAFTISTTPGGFFDVHERWTGIPVWLSAVSEAGAIVLGVVGLLVERSGRLHRPPRPGAPANAGA